MRSKGLTPPFDPPVFQKPVDVQVGQERAQYRSLRCASLGQADAAAKFDEKGEAAEGKVSASKGMEIYQFMESGLALQATLQGTKYWKDKDLNEAGK